MPGPLPASPLRYDPSMETPAEDEAETTAALVETMRGICETTYKDYGRAVRAVHAKSHGLLRGELRVADGLLEPLAQGLFARPAVYPVVMRFSTNPGDLLDDSVSAPRGLAVKVIGVDGARLPGSGGAVTQDFVMANAPAFIMPNAKAFLKSLKPLVATTDTPQVLKKALSSTLRGVEAVVEKLGGGSTTLKASGGQPATHILGETFHSQVPLLNGPYMMKVSVAPASPELTALTGAPVDLTSGPNALRDAVTAFFAGKGGAWEVRVQLRTDPDAMPIEDASVVWPEEASPHVVVARIVVPPQPAWSDARAAGLDDGLAFSPWHGLAAHRPVGSIMRARKAAYEMSARFREERNGRPVTEPRAAAGLPD